MSVSSPISPVVDHLLARRLASVPDPRAVRRVYRELAAARPDAYRPDLASSLNNLSNGPADLGRREEALAANAEATGIHRELAARWPDVYHHELEHSWQVAAWLESGEDPSDAYSRESKA